MKVNVRSAGRRAAGMAWVAIRSFAATLLILTVLGAVLAGLSCYFLREYGPWYGVAAVAVVLIESVTIGVVLGAKRAVVMALAHGLSELRLGRVSVRLVFERMLGIAAGEKSAQRGGRISQTMERLPLAQAEELLSGAVRDMTGDPAQGGWLRRTIQRRLLEAIRKYTLARFREEGAKHGGIDLVKVQEELEQTLDDVLVEKVRGGLRIWTAIALIGLPLVVAVQSRIAIVLLHYKS